MKLAQNFKFYLPKGGQGDKNEHGSQTSGSFMKPLVGVGECDLQKPSISRSLYKFLYEEAKGQRL
jgi:hypothetical protein